ncbi:MAG: hypothetical protein N2Z62_14400, partial [Rhodobacteraceae bacterium]|nr:hypothetical protein [Paracoccaceae bacterium]
ARSLGERRARHRAAAAAPPARPAAAIRLGAEVPRQAEAPPLALAFPAPPPPGKAWPAPPGPAAAALSALSERFRLVPVPQDAAGTWAAWLIPDVHEADERSGGHAGPGAHAPGGPSGGSR